MREIVSSNRALQAFRHVVVSAPMMEPEAGVIYRIKPKDAPKHARGLRQNGHTQRSNAVRSAKELWPNAKTDVDFTVYRHDGFFGFVPAGGTPQPSMADAKAKPKAATQAEVTPAQRRKALLEITSIIDAETGRYLDSWTDAHVAQATDLPESLIAEVRVQFYGEPKAELTATERATLMGLKVEVDAIIAAHKKLAATAEGLSDRITAALEGKH